MWQPSLRRRGFTLVELLVVIAIISIIAGLVIPTLQSVWSDVHKVQCTNNLRAIHSAALLYARKEGSFPLAPGRSPRAHDSLNLLIQSPFGEDLEPATFVCPASQLEKALLEDGSSMALEGPAKFVLDETTCGYAWRGVKTGLSKKCVLASDKYFDGYEDEHGVHPGHRGYILVVDSTGAVREVEIDHPQLTEDKLPPGLLR